MPNARIQSSTPNTGIRGTVTNTRVSNFQTTRAGEVTLIPAGTPIGLLLALTYAAATPSYPFHGDYRPNVWIRNT